MKLLKKIKIFSLVIILLITINSSKYLKNNQNQPNNEQASSPSTLAPFDIPQTIELMRDVAKIILDTPSDLKKQKEFELTKNECFRHFNDDRKEYTPVLKLFFDRCAYVSKNVEQDWDNKVFDETIMAKLASTTIQIEGKKTTCQLELKYKPTIDKKQLVQPFSKVFGGFNNPDTKNKEKFITSQFSAHRNTLPGSAFITMNKESRKP